MGGLRVMLMHTIFTNQDDWQRVRKQSLQRKTTLAQSANQTPIRNADWFKSHFPKFYSNADWLKIHFLSLFTGLLSLVLTWLKGANMRLAMKSDK